MELIARGDADGDGKTVDPTTGDRKNRASARAKREHYVQRGGIQLGGEPSTNRAKNGTATGVRRHSGHAGLLHKTVAVCKGTRRFEIHEFQTQACRVLDKGRNDRAGRGDP